jgi:hypothetical protein
MEPLSLVVAVAQTQNTTRHTKEKKKDTGAYLFTEIAQLLVVVVVVDLC